MIDPTILVTANGYNGNSTPDILFTVIPTGNFDGLDWTRASTKTRVNASGVIETMGNDIPTFDYTGSVCPAIGIEPQRTNAFQRSEEINNAYWTKTGATVTANTQTAPDNKLTADSLIATNSTGRHEVSRSIGTSGVTPGVRFIASFYAKKGNVDYAYIEGLLPVWLGSCIVDLNNGNVVSQTGVSDVTVTLINGYYRISLSIIHNNTGANAVVRFGMTSSPTSTSSTLTTSDFTYMWGFQWEHTTLSGRGFNPTSYISTTTASVTRNADSVSIPSSLQQYVGLTEGTLFLKINYKNYKANTTTYIVANSASIYSDNLGRIGGTYTGSANILSSSSYPEGILKIAFAYKQNSFVLYVNGVLIGTDNLGSVSPNANMSLGQNANEIIYGAIYNERLSNSDLATLTTL